MEKPWGSTSKKNPWGPQPKEEKGESTKEKEKAGHFVKGNLYYQGGSSYGEDNGERMEHRWRNQGKKRTGGVTRRQNNQKKSIGRSGEFDLGEEKL